MHQIYLSQSVKFKPKVKSSDQSGNKDSSPEKYQKKTLRRFFDSNKLTLNCYSSLEISDKQPGKINLRTLHLDVNENQSKKKYKEEKVDAVKPSLEMQYKRKIESIYLKNEKEKLNQIIFRHDLFDNLQYDDYQAGLIPNSRKEKYIKVKGNLKYHNSLEVLSAQQTNQPQQMENHSLCYEPTNQNPSMQSQHFQPKIKFNQFKYKSQLKLFNKSSTFASSNVTQRQKILSKNSQSPDKQTPQKTTENFSPTRSRKASVDYLGARNQFIRNSTERTGLKVQIDELKHFQQNLLTRSQHASDFQSSIIKKKEELKRQRLSVYLNIYEDVKEHTGINKQREHLIQRAQEIAEIIHSTQTQQQTDGSLVVDDFQINTLQSNLIDPNWLYKDSDQKNQGKILIHNESIEQITLQTSPLSLCQVQSSGPQDADVSDPRFRKKKVDKELLNILIDGWQNAKKRKQKLHPFKLLQITVNPDKEQKRLKKQKIATSLLDWLKKMNRCRIFMGTLTREHNEIFPKKPYSQEGSFVFLRCIKFNNIQQVEKLLDQNFKLVYEYNEVGHTALHIAARAGHNQLISFLLTRGADYEQKDMANRTPLYYAADQAHRSSFKTLITAGAQPWAISTADPVIQKWLKMIKKV